MVQSSPGQRIAGIILLGIGVVLAINGLLSIPHGRVAGGNIIWVIYFGACALFTGCGIQVFRSKK